MKEADQDGITTQVREVPTFPNQGQVDELGVPISKERWG